MFLTQRLIRILNELIHHDGGQSIDIEGLAKRFNVSERSIRNDLEMIDDLLKMNKLPVLNRHTRVEVSIEKNEDSRKQHIQLLTSLRTTTSYPSPQERREMVFIDILFRRRTIDIQYFVKRLDVSRSTVISDIRELKKELKSMEIDLCYTPKEGYFLEGDESKVRREAHNLLSNQQVINDYIEESIQKKYWTDFSLEDVQFIERFVDQIEKLLKKTYSGNAYFHLVNSIIMSISRIQQNYLISNSEQLEKFESAEYILLAEQIKELECRFKITITSKEKWFLITLFLGGSLIKSENFLNDEWLTIQLLTDQFISKMSKRLNVSLHQDPDLFSALVLHLGPAINRLKNEVFLKNEIIQYIKNMYGPLFTIVDDILNTLVDAKEIVFSADEIGFITLHVASAIEKLSVASSYPNVIIICNYGIGTSNLLETRIKKYLSFNVEGSYTIRELSKDLINKKSIDLIISTIPINRMDYPPIVEVSPLLSREEIKKLREFEVKNTVTNSNLIKNEKDYARERIPMLSDLLVEDTVQANVKVDNWEEAVRYGGQLLKDKGIVEQDYIEAMVNTVKELGTYIVIAPNIAMPHASSKDGVNEIGFSLITLRDPVIFGHPENDPVKIVICLAAIDHNSHLRALRDLMQFLNDKNFVEELKCINSSEEIVKYIRGEKNES